ncbi:hypothetical protein AVEN_119331-1 [Araneus ventricosus]|uniref:Uncharacterized protein n=1 Tax=Araneus ventricosus TaxID=182803 RepID=A0A4Y2TNJ3_ARAVE|nr:hypothetical protein AVEN_119331-1 [Araneus ventricosus]
MYWWKCIIIFLSGINDQNRIISWLEFTGVFISVKGVLKDNFKVSINEVVTGCRRQRTIRKHEEGRVAETLKKETMANSLGQEDGRNRDKIITDCLSKLIQARREEWEETEEQQIRISDMFDCRPRRENQKITKEHKEIA